MGKAPESAGGDKLHESHLLKPWHTERAHRFAFQSVINSPATTPSMLAMKHPVQMMMGCMSGCLLRFGCVLVVGKWN